MCYNWCILFDLNINIINILNNFLDIYNKLKAY